MNTQACKGTRGHGRRKEARKRRKEGRRSKEEKNGRKCRQIEDRLRRPRVRKSKMV